MLPAEALERTDPCFSLRVTMVNGGPQETTVVSVRGDIDLITTPRLLDGLLPVIENGAGTVVVDLSEVPFMDSTGVHLLVDAVRRLERHDRRLAIACREGGQVHRLLALVGLLDALTVHSSRRGAVLGSDDRLYSHPTGPRARGGSGEESPEARTLEPPEDR